ncbi:MAG: hypothetical protein LZF86_10187 [Nitrospira sp.]|nr:MAG: hypothetical protein LZF86_10187 [Nitrospira sp.]
MSGPSRHLRRLNGLTSDSGVCLSELMVALAIGTLVLAGSLEAFNIVQAQAVRQQRVMAAQQEMRLGLEVFEQEVRMASSATIVIARSDRFEFSANIHGLRTVTTGSVAAGQTVLPVQNGSGWEAGKPIVLCGVSRCESHRLGIPGQRSQLLLSSPVGGTYPAGASVEVRNRVTYYTRMDDRDRMQLMRQVDGGAGVLIGDLQSVRLSYWDEWGRAGADIGRIVRVVVEFLPIAGDPKVVRDVTVRS